MESKYKENKALTFQQMTCATTSSPNETFEAVIAKVRARRAPRPLCRAPAQGQVLDRRDARARARGASLTIARRRRAFIAIARAGLMDAILCGEGSIANADKMMSEISRVLKPNGVFLVTTARRPRSGERPVAGWGSARGSDGTNRHDAQAEVAGAVADAGGLHYVLHLPKGQIGRRGGRGGSRRGRGCGRRRGRGSGG